MTDYRWLQAFLPLALIFAWFGAGMFLRLPRFTWPWLYFLLHAGVTAFWPQWLPSYMAPALAIQVQRNAGEILFLLAILPVAVFGSPRWAKSFLMDFILVIMVVDFFLMLGEGWSLLYTWTSFYTAMAALLLPYAFRQFNWRWVAGLALVLAIIVYHGSTGLMVVGAMFTAHLLQRRQWWYAMAAVVLGLVLVSVNIKLTTYGVGGGRLEAWAQYMGWWWDHANHWVGAGTGALEWIAPFLPVKVGSETLKMALMHNDYLQVLFDTGAIGLVLFLLGCFGLLKRCWRSQTAFPTCVGFMVCMLTYFPLHYGIGQVIACILVTEAIDNG